MPGSCSVVQRVPSKCRIFLSHSSQMFAQLGEPRVRALGRAEGVGEGSRELVHSVAGHGGVGDTAIAVTCLVIVAVAAHGGDEQGSAYEYTSIKIGYRFHVSRPLKEISAVLPAGGVRVRDPGHRPLEWDPTDNSDGLLSRDAGRTTLRFQRLAGPRLSRSG